MVLSRERFCEIIKSIQNEELFLREINSIPDRIEGCGYSEIMWYPPSCEYELCETLEAMFNDNTGAVSWFCFEIDFGNRYKPGDNMINGEEFPVRNAEELYDYLIKKS